MAVDRAQPLAESLATFVSQFDLKKSSAMDALFEKAKMHILDGMGVALASTKMEDGYAQKLLPAGRGFGTSSDCTIIGFQERAAPMFAAFMNGSLIHGCEFDDAGPGPMHTESFGVATALALTEQRGLDGWKLAEGWVLAAEVAIRLARGCNEGGLNNSGFHTTSILGTVGAAAAAAKLLELDAKGITEAISVSVSFSSGTNQGWVEGSGRNKPIQPGWAATSGLMAAFMAESGFECSHNTLDGPNGLFSSHAWKQGWTAERVLNDLGDTWRCLDIPFKIYSAAGMCQNAIECTRQLVLEHDIQPGEVEAVEVELPTLNQRHLLPPRYGESFRPKSGYAMHGSWVCNVARMILSRAVGTEHLTMDALREPEFQALTDKIRCHAVTEDYPVGERSTGITIKTTRGVFERALYKSPGSADVVSRERIQDKFRQNASLVLSAPKVNEIPQIVFNLEKLDDAGRLARLLSAEGPA